LNPSACVLLCDVWKYEHSSNFWIWKFYHNNHICEGMENENFLRGSSHLFCVNLTDHIGYKNKKFCLKNHFLSEYSLTVLFCHRLRNNFLVVIPCNMHISRVFGIKSFFTNRAWIHKSIGEVNWFHMISSIFPLLYYFQTQRASIMV